MGWLGTHLLGGFSTSANAFVALDATTGARVPSDPIPDSSLRTWMSPDGDRVYMTNFESTDDPGHGFVSVYSGETAKLLDVSFDLGEGLPRLGFGDQGQLPGGHHPVDRQRGDDRNLRRTHREDHRGRSRGADRDRHHSLGRAARRAGRSHHAPRPDARWSARGRFPAPAARSTAFRSRATVGRFSPPRTTTRSPCTTCRQDAGSATRSPLRPRSSDRARCAPMACSSWSTSADGIQVWDADPAHQFEAVCRIAGARTVG